jgi:hypothetical protein
MWIAKLCRREEISESIDNTDKKSGAGGIRRRSLTNPLNSQLDTNVAIGGLGKK